MAIGQNAAQKLLNVRVPAEWRKLGLEVGNFRRVQAGRFESLPKEPGERASPIAVATNDPVRGIFQYGICRNQQRCYGAGRQSSVTHLIQGDQRSAAHAWVFAAQTLGGRLAGGNLDQGENNGVLKNALTGVEFRAVDIELFRSVEEGWNRSRLADPPKRLGRAATHLQILIVQQGLQRRAGLLVAPK